MAHLRLTGSISSQLLCSGQMGSKLRHVKQRLSTKITFSPVQAVHQTSLIWWQTMVRQRTSKALSIGHNFNPQVRYPIVETHIYPGYVRSEPRRNNVGVSQVNLIALASNWHQFQLKLNFRSKANSTWTWLAWGVLEVWSRTVRVHFLVVSLAWASKWLSSIPGPATQTTTKLSVQSFPWPT